MYGLAWEIAVNVKLGAAKDDDVEPGRGDDDVRFERLARLEQDAGLGKRPDPVSNDRGSPGANRLVIHFGRDMT